MCESPLKSDTKEHIATLQKSNFKIIVITGDNGLVAANVA